MTAILALDPSLVATGWAVVRISPCTLEAAGVIKTKPEVGRGLVAEDDARRVRVIRRALIDVVRRYQPALVVMEAAAGSQSAKAAKALGIAQAVCLCVVDEHFDDAGCALYVTAHEAKRAACGRKDASKEDVARGVLAAFGDEHVLAAIGARSVVEAMAPRFEGAMDACAVALAAWDRPLVAALRTMARAAPEEARI